MKHILPVMCLGTVLLQGPAWAADCEYDIGTQSYGSWTGSPGSVFVPCTTDESSHCTVQQNMFGGYQSEAFPSILRNKTKSLLPTNPAYTWPAYDMTSGDEVCCVKNGGPTGNEGWTDGHYPSTCCGGSARGLGMAVWSVTEPTLDLWVHDVPVWYQPGRCPRLEFKLTYKHLSGGTGLPDWFGFGPRWEANFRAYAAVLVHNDITNNVTVHHGDGSVITYNLQNSNSFYSGASIALRDGGGFVLTYPGGVKHEFGAAVTNSGYVRYCLSKIDYRSTSTSDDVVFSYQTTNNTLRLTCITDGAGHQTTFSYTNIGTNTALITRISTPGGLTASFAYDSNGWLTNITDAVGNNSGFVYDGSNSLRQLLTPYGTTTFSVTNTIVNDVFVWQALQVDELGLRKHLFVYLEEDSWGRVPTGYTTEVPNTVSLGYANTFETTNLNLRNSFYWAPRQYDRLPGTLRTNLDQGTFHPDQLASTNLLRARQRHWLKQRGGERASQTISIERGASVDGSTPGPLTWYDYDGKINNQNEREGIYRQPKLVAQILPNDQTSFVYKERNRWGNPTRIVETALGPDSGLVFRETTMVYTNGGRDVILRINADDTQAGYHYSPEDSRLDYATNALGEVTQYNLDDNVIITPALTLATTFGDTNHPGLPTMVVETGTGVDRTNRCTYTNGLIWTQTNPRGLTVTNLYDALGRLVSVSYPDGTYTSNYFDRLLLAGVRNRLGNWNSFGYDSYGRKTGFTNALGRATTYTYCNCGSLESITDAVGNTTTIQYDDLGRRTRVTHPDTSWEEAFYDSLGQAVRVVKSSGDAITNAYNHQGILYAVSNALGCVRYKEFDRMDRLSKTVDANGVSVVQEYDPVGRLRHISRNNGTSDEWLTYDATGKVSNTKDQATTLYTNDAAGRPIAVRNPNGEVVEMRYDTAGALTNLVDPAGKTTKWLYDAHGRITNKLDDFNNLVFLYRYDAEGHLTNRWTPAKGNTYYAYDAVGNLTNVDYANSTGLRLGYDALNRLTNLVDAVGQTRYAYDVFGELILEDGPWDNDALNLNYTNLHRSGLALSQPNGAAWTQSYSHDEAGRLTNIVGSAGSFSYGYRVGQVRLPGSIFLPGGLSITNDYDSLSRLTGRWLKATDSTILDSHTYDWTANADRVQQTTRFSGNTMAYTYDAAGQLIWAKGKEAGGKDRLHEQWGYAYDPAGNLIRKTNNAMVTVVNVGDYGVDQVYGGYADWGTELSVAGSVSTNSTNVTVNGTIAYGYADGSFVSVQPWSNGTNTYMAVALDALGRRVTNSVHAVLHDEDHPWRYSYDANGNMTNSAGRCLEYDDENQLVRITEPGAWKSEFAYDGRLRRRLRKEFTWLGESSSWLQTNEVRYIYDGMLVIQERHYSPQLSIDVPQLIVSYTRGLDLGGRLESSGGIGGLLARTEASPSNLNIAPSTGIYFCDHVGNVTMVVATNGRIAARYFYEPFGNVVAMYGNWAERNLYRFSGKEWHPNSGLVYYGYRFYSPNLQRWVNRDPAGEMGGRNLYGFVRNMPVTKYDALGLFDRDRNMCDTLEDIMVDFLNNEYIRDDPWSESLLSAMNTLWYTFCGPPNKPPSVICPDVPPTRPYEPPLPPRINEYRHLPITINTPPVTIGEPNVDPCVVGFFVGSMLILIIGSHCLLPRPTPF